MSSSRAERRRRLKWLRKEEQRSAKPTARKGVQQRDVPTLRVCSATYSHSDRVHAVASGGLGVIHEMVRSLGLAEAINDNLQLLKRKLPYFESDHVLTIAYNLLAGGTCLEDVNQLRSDPTLLAALGASRLPGASTLGDFTRRFDEDAIVLLMDLVNDVRQKVWAQQGPEFLEEATIDGDGTILPVEGRCKEGVGASYKGVIGYHPLIISLAQTQEPLFIVNRPGNANSCRGAAEWYDAAIQRCRAAGFRRITLRGDTAFSQTSELDRWTDDGVRCLFGYRVSPEVLEKAENVPKRDWKPLARRQREVKTSPRGRRANHRQGVIEEREFTQLTLKAEWIAELSHRPAQADRQYRLIVLKKDIEKSQGQLPLLLEDRYFVYVTNDWETSAEELVFEANQRCHQEKLIKWLKSDAPAICAPVDSLLSNWAYMVMASLSWSLKVWFTLLLPEGGRWASKYRKVKRDATRMEFKRFLNTFIRIPAQIIQAAGRIQVRFLAWTSGLASLFRVLDRLNKPLRC